MPVLWVVRHAKSSWNDAALSDHARDLNGRGLRDGPVIGEWLAARQAPPTHILTSDAVRTRRTAEFLRVACALPPEAVQPSNELYLASAHTLLANLRELPPSCVSAAIVGHNPGISDIANALLTQSGIPDMPTLGIAGIDLPGDWSSLNFGSGALIEFTSPKRLH